jgi:hypothetical protein
MGDLQDVTRWVLVRNFEQDLYYAIQVTFRRKLEAL